PHALRLDHAPMIEAVSIAGHAVNLTPRSLGDTVVVVGAGMIGQLTIQAARVAGFGRIFAVDIDDAKLAMAAKLGADETFNSKSCDAPAEIIARTASRGADAALAAVGATYPIRTAIAAERKGGVVTLIGNLPPTIELPLQSVVTRQIRLQGSCASAGEYPACIELLSTGAIRVDGMISARTPLDEAASWFDRLYRHEPNLMKV